MLTKLQKGDFYDLQGCRYDMIMPDDLKGLEIPRSQIIIGLTGPFGSGCTLTGEYLRDEYFYRYYKFSDLIKEIYNRLDKNEKEKIVNDEDGVDYNDVVSKTIVTATIDNYTKEKECLQKTGNYFRKRNRGNNGFTFWAEKICEVIEKDNEIFKNILRNIDRSENSEVVSDAFKKSLIADIKEIIGNKKYDKLINSFYKLLHNFKEKSLKSNLKKMILDLKCELIIIDGFKNEDEVFLFRNFSFFFLFAISASYNVRWQRVRENFNGDSNEFDRLEKVDQDEENKPYGQRVSKCVSMSDISIINNNDFKKSNIYKEEFMTKVDSYLKLVKEAGSREPNIHELAMDLASDVSLMSVCLQQQVGAVIVDSTGNIQSFGYNRTPDTINSCKKDYLKCYRDHIEDSSPKCDKCGKPIIEDETQKRFGKNLDLCRALHAEEMAILSIAKRGGASVKDSTIYTTLYPCRLCANKIVETGIKKVYYDAPYPDQISIDILQSSGVEVKQFEGVKYRAFEKLFKNHRRELEYQSERIKPPKT